MTLGNMRGNGVRPLAVRCLLCHHQAVLSVGRSAAGGGRSGKEVEAPSGGSVAVNCLWKILLLRQKNFAELANCRVRYVSYLY
jgi:hypothetical protein